MTDPTREQIDESSVQDPAWGVQMMAEGWSDAIGKANARIAELEQQVKQLTMLERMASQHASRRDADIAEADHRLAQAKAEIARLNAAERRIYADLLEKCTKAQERIDELEDAAVDAVFSDVFAERDEARQQVQVLQDRIAKAKTICADHADCDQAFGEISAVLDGIESDDDEE